MHILLVNWPKSVPNEAMPDCHRRIGAVLESWQIYEQVQLVSCFDHSLRGALKIRCVKIQDSYFNRSGTTDLLDKEMTAVIGDFLSDQNVSVHFDSPDQLRYLN